LGFIVNFEVLDYMRLVTITTDFGTRDGYVASLKGTLYSAHSSLQVEDLVHDLEPFDIVVGALFVKQAITHFPNRTIHLAAVDVLYDTYGSLLIGHKQGHIVIAPNNGMLSLLGYDDQDEVYLNEFVYQGYDGYLRGIKQILEQIMADRPLSTLGTIYPGHKRRFDLQATIRPGQIRASVIHIDKFENAILNVDKGLFEETRNGRPFSIFYKRTNPINEISSSYGSIPIGEVGAIINSYGLLEIGINKGKAHSLLGLGKEDAIIIEFEEE